MNPSNAVTALELSGLCKNSVDIVLLDVREPSEREICVIPAGNLIEKHIALAQLVDRLDEIPADKCVVVYCHHGRRSAMAAAILRENGFADVRNLTGGIDAWSTQVDSKVARY